MFAYESFNRSWFCNKCQSFSPTPRIICLKLLLQYEECMKYIFLAFFMQIYFKFAFSVLFDKDTFLEFSKIMLRWVWIRFSYVLSIVLELRQNFKDDKIQIILLVSIAFFDGFHHLRIILLHDICKIEKKSVWNHDFERMWHMYISISMIQKKIRI